MTYHFYLFVGKFPKLFNFSGGKEKSYVVELNIFKENAFYGLRKILLDSFSRNLYIWSAIVNGTYMQKIKIGHRAQFCRFYFRFARFYAAFNFRWAYFDSLSWRVHLGVDCAREKPFRASLNLNGIEISFSCEMMGPSLAFKTRVKVIRKWPVVWRILLWPAILGQCCFIDGSRARPMMA